VAFENWQSLARTLCSLAPLEEINRLIASENCASTSNHRIPRNRELALEPSSFLSDQIGWYVKQVEEALGLE
jgi:hypothetical protein